MGIAYVLSDGTISKNYPYLFSEREKLVNQAKQLAVNLKYTKKLDNDNFIDTWVNDPIVKQYRQLLKSIWGFMADKTIIKTVTLCDNCENMNNLFNVDRESVCHDGYIFHMVLCQKCLDDEIRLWSNDCKIEYKPL